MSAQGQCVQPGDVSPGNGYHPAMVDLVVCYLGRGNSHTTTNLNFSQRLFLKP